VRVLRRRPGRRCQRPRNRDVVWGLVALALVSGAGSAAAGTIGNFTVQPYFFSPARGDSVTFRFVLNDTATVFLFVVQSDSSTVVDTLIAGAVFRNGPEQKAVWHGRYFDGTSAPQDTFLALIRTDTGAERDSLFSPRFFIDETPPQVFITLVDPGLIVPGSSDPAQSPDAEITCEVSDPPPSDSLQVDVVVYGPDGSRISTLAERRVAANGVFISVWKGETAKQDGLHALDVTVRDRASNSASAKAYVDVDKDGPTVTVTNVASGSTLRELPDSLFGWAWDRNGVRDSVWAEYPGRTAFSLIESTHTRLDTLFFAAAFRDSIAEEGMQSFRFKAVDGAGQIRLKAFEITWDESPPPAPILDQPPAVSHSPFVLLDGTVGGNASDVMRIYRNDALVDTLFPKIEGRWPHTLRIVPGLNRIWAVMADNAGNVSPPSNTIEVTFDPSTGLYIPQPFHPGDTFEINVAETARTVTLRIFDLSGHAVRVLDVRPASNNLTVSWNGRNGDGDAVKKGPLVAVVFVEFASGGNETLRKVFLFEPNA
jgi:hypothetical protein